MMARMLGKKTIITYSVGDTGEFVISQGHPHRPGLLTTVYLSRAQMRRLVEMVLDTEPERWPPEDRGPLDGTPSDVL